MIVKSGVGRWAICVCECVWLWGWEMSDRIRRSPPSFWTKLLCQLKYGANESVITVLLSRVVRRFSFFLSKTKSWPPVEFLCRGCARRAIFLSLWDPWEMLNQPSTPPRLLPSITPTFPQSHHISLPPRLELTIALICCSDRSPQNTLFLSFLSSSLCSGLQLLPVSLSPLLSCCLSTSPLTPTCNLPPLICRLNPLLFRTSWKALPFLSLPSSPLFILCCFLLLPSSKAIWRSLGPVRRPRGLVALWGDISE